MVDATTQYVPPFSKTTYVLRSFLQSERRSSSSSSSPVSEAPAVDELSEGCALVHLPQSRRVGDSLRFVERLKKMSSQLMASHRAVTSNRFRHVILPEFNPWAGNTIGLIQQQLHKDVRIVAGPTMAAFLSDSTFFKEVRGLLLQQQAAVATAFGGSSSLTPFTLDEMPFAGISADAIDTIESGSVVHVTPPTASTSQDGSQKAVSARSLTIVSGDSSSGASSASQSKGSGVRNGGNQPAHFRDQRYFVYDHACKTMFAGDAAGVRIPWATHIVENYNTKARGLNFPVPAPLHYRSTPAAFSAAAVAGGGATGGSSSAAASAALFSHWNVEESLETAVRALSQYNAVQRVLSSSYGELGCDREDVIQRLTAATESLTAMRKRLAAKHFSLGVTSSKAAAQCREPLSAALHKKIWDELIAVEDRKVDTAAATAEMDPKKESLRLASRDVMSQLFAVDLAAALSASAVLVAPAEGAVQAKIVEDAKSRAELEKKAAEKQSKQADDAAETTPAASAASTAILDKLFVKRGLQQLSPILTKQDIDVGVFLAMKPDELTATFRVTFGLRKKLEMLQTELKAKMGPQ
jgi:hypothetical protein